MKVLPTDKVSLTRELRAAWIAAEQRQHHYQILQERFAAVHHEREHLAQCLREETAKREEAEARSRQAEAQAASALRLAEPLSREQALRHLRATLPDAQVSVACHRGRKRHGRQETRVLWYLGSAGLCAYLGASGTVGTPWPGVRQVCRL